MRRYRCRVCKVAIGGTPLLALENMPRAAQNFPSAADLESDRGNALALFHCADCGLVQLQCAPVPYYREVIRAAAFSEEMRAFRQSQFADWGARYNLHGKSMLEVGCGRGEYLTLLRDAGMQVHGLEYSPVSVLHCKRQGLSVSRGFLARSMQELTAGPFDGFATFNFMEHWPNPVTTLKGIRNNLVNDGIGFVEVPNFDMILEQGLYSEFIADHLSYFTRASLTYALQSAGFEVLECSTIWHDYILSAVVRKRAIPDLMHLRSRMSSTSAAIHHFLRNFPPHSVAIWGAGHQALATIALAGIGSEIKYVVDSAPFKQNRFTPATHIPVVAPDALGSDPPSAVIVMAASYSDEVLGILSKAHGAKLPTAVLRDFGLELT